MEKCDICRNNDLPTKVLESSVGPVSYRYCSCCVAMRAENYGTIETFGIALPSVNYYDLHQDGYFNYNTDRAIPIKTIGGGVYNTRSEYIESTGGKKNDKIKMANDYTPYKKINE